MFHAQNIHRGLLEIAKQSEVVLNSGLSKRPVITGKECPRFGFGIRRHNQSLRMRVPDSGLEILYLPIPDAVNGSALVMTTVPEKSVTPADVAFKRVCFPGSIARDVEMMSPAVR